MNENERSPEFSRMARVREVQSDSVPEVFCWCSGKALLSVLCLTWPAGELDLLELSHHAVHRSAKRCSYLFRALANL